MLGLEQPSPSSLYCEDIDFILFIYLFSETSVCLFVLEESSVLRLWCPMEEMLPDTWGLPGEETATHFLLCGLFVAHIGKHCHTMGTANI